MSQARYPAADACALRAATWNRFANGAICISQPARSEAVLLEGKRCTGVQYFVAGSMREARAAREVVVGAGTFNSPQLLALSDIRQPERLRNLGIEVHQELSGRNVLTRRRSAKRLRIWCYGIKPRESEPLSSSWSGLAQPPTTLRR
jgi:choline dehydrogenase-like flavoprotein